MATATTTSASSSSSPYSVPCRSPLLIIQLNCQADYDANYAACSALIREAAGRGAGIVFTPENTTRLTALSLPFDVHSAYYEDEHPSIAGLQAAGCRAQRLDQHRQRSS